MYRKNIEVAKKYRTTTGRCGGVVVVFKGEVSGWVNELRNPEHWEPGCVAVDSSGVQFKASGGNYSDGAERWEQIG